jgi:SAM-dependent methyltransferase
MAVKEPRGQELVDRYKKSSHIPIDADVTEDMILAHWELEKRLTKELLESTSRNRWEVFERCYTTLYGELDWLNRLPDTAITIPPSQLYRNWVSLIGQPPKRIYEIGSGSGKMIAYLASLGFECKATEITRERGQKHVSEHPNLSWAISDGVHLGRFETPNSQDVVISNQVIEHLHPNDLCDHFKGCWSILSNGGIYIFATPHRHGGPNDVSRVFKCDEAKGMHLKEYTYAELKQLLTEAGFKHIYAVWRIPSSIAILNWISNMLGPIATPRMSRTYLSYLLIIERLISLLPRQAFRRKATWLARCILFFSIFLIAQKNELGKQQN